MATGNIIGKVNVPISPITYTGDSTRTATVNVDNEERVITVDVNVEEVTKDSATKVELNTAVETLDSTKQDNLISGENIKTINGNSILGSGDIETPFPTNYVTTDTAQEIAGDKTFNGYVVFNALKTNKIENNGQIDFCPAPSENFYLYTKYNNYVGGIEVGAQVGDFLPAFTIDYGYGPQFNGSTMRFRTYEYNEKDVGGQTIPLPSMEYEWCDIENDIDYHGYLTFPALDGVQKIATLTDLSNKEDISNKVTSLSASSKDTQYPSAKCVYDTLESLINTNILSYSATMEILTSAIMPEGTTAENNNITFPEGVTVNSHNINL